MEQLHKVDRKCNYYLHNYILSSLTHALLTVNTFFFLILDEKQFAIKANCWYLYSFPLFFLTVSIGSSLYTSKHWWSKFLDSMESSANMSLLFKNISLSFEVWHTISKQLENQMWSNGVISLWDLDGAVWSWGFLFIYSVTIELLSCITALMCCDTLKLFFFNLLFHPNEKLQLIYCRKVMDFQPAPNWTSYSS